MNRRFMRTVGVLALGLWMGSEAAAGLVKGTSNSLPRMVTKRGETFALGKKPYPAGTREQWIAEGRALARAPEGSLRRPKALKGWADNRSYLPPIRSQGAEGSCVHWAGTYYTKTANMKRRNPSINVTATSNQCSPRFTYNLTNRGFDNGGYGHEPFEIFMRYGVASLKQEPYVAGQYETLPTVADFVEGLHRRTASYVWVWSWDPTAAQINELKAFLDDGGVAACSTYAEDSFDAWGKGDPPWVGTKCAAYDVNHMVTVCGYGPGYYLVANSWGASFGSNGYIVVDSDYFENYFGDVMYPLEGTYEPATSYAKVQIQHGRRSDIRSLSFSVNGATVWSNSPLPKSAPLGTGWFNADNRDDWALAVDLTAAPWGSANVVTARCMDKVSGMAGTLTNFTLWHDGTYSVSASTPVAIPDNAGAPASARIVAGGSSPAQSPYPSGAPWTLPGRVEMENFDLGGQGVAYSDGTALNEGGQYRPVEGVGTARDAVAGNGCVVGWTLAGEWLEYTVAIGETGTYALETRVAGAGAGGQFRILVNGADKTGLLAVPNTGAWNAYQVVQKTGVALLSGIQTVRVEMVTAGASGYVGAFDWFQVFAPPARSAYPSGAPWALPGTVEMENFDLGGNGVAYSDATTANEGGQYRMADSVDIARDAGAGSGCVVGWTPAGEWLEYTVDIGETGTYSLETRVAAAGAGGQFRILVNDEDKTGLLTVPNTGAWNAYQVVQKTGVALSSGIQTIRVEMVAAGTSGHVGAFDWFRVVEETPGVQSAYPSGAPWTLPGTVEMENFDAGGQGVAYNDSTPMNEGGQYRLTEAVGIARDAGAGNGCVVGWTPAGEWLEYTVDMLASGTYTLDARVAAVGSGGQFRILVNGADKTGLLAVPNTGAWNAYQVVRKTGVALSSGIQTVRVEMVAAGTSGHAGAFDWFRVVAAAGKSSAAGFGLSNVEFPTPVDVRTSDEIQQPARGWLAVDQDAHTAWRGTPGAGGWWLALVYDSPVSLHALVLDWAPGSPTNVQCLSSLDAETWRELVLPLTHGPVALRYLWLLFPDAGEGRVPLLREMQFK